MRSLFKIIPIIVTLIFITIPLSELWATGFSNDLQVILRTEGDFFVEWFETDYVIYPTLKTGYTVRLYTLEEDNPFINVDIVMDDWLYERDNPKFDQAELVIYSSLFSMENGSSKRIDFSWSDSYHYHFTPKIQRYDGYSQYLCSYSFNLSQSIKKAKISFADATGYTTSEQSNLRCMISFVTTGLTQGISEGGQEKQLRFGFVCRTHELENFHFHLSIPDDFNFIGQQTLNGKEMYETPTRVSGWDFNDRGFDSSGDPFWMCNAVVNWRVPRTLLPWEMHPLDWILSGLVGFSISSSLIYARRRLWKPKLSVNVVTKPWVHSQIRFAFYRLIVKNKGRTTAHDCRIHITFKDSNQNRLFSINGKWDSLPEPTGPLQAGGLSSAWPAFIPFSEKLNLGSGESDTFCIVLKDNEDPCYAYNARSYLYNYKNPRWRLTIGEYFVDVEIKCEETKTHQSFHIRNFGNGILDVETSKLT